jgi:hypothetical protein
MDKNYWGIKTALSENGEIYAFADADGITCTPSFPGRLYRSVEAAFLSDLRHRCRCRSFHRSRRVLTPTRLADRHQGGRLATVLAPLPREASREAVYRIGTFPAAWAEALTKRWAVKGRAVSADCATWVKRYACKPSNRAPFATRSTIGVAVPISVINRIPICGSVSRTRLSADFASSRRSASAKARA